MGGPERRGEGEGRGQGTGPSTGPGSPPDAFDRALARAPVAVAFEVEVASGVGAAWAALTAVEAWPRWHRGIDFAVLRGDHPAPGVRLHWKGDGMRIRSVVTTVIPPGRHAARQAGSQGAGGPGVGPGAGHDPPRHGALSAPDLPPSGEARLEWSLSMLGGRGAQRWTLAPVHPPAGGLVSGRGEAEPGELPSPRVRIRLEEWWSGVSPRLLRGTLQRTLHVARSAWLARLRDHLESGASPSPPSSSPDPPAPPPSP